MPDFTPDELACEECNSYPGHAPNCPAYAQGMKHRYPKGKGGLRRKKAIRCDHYTSFLVSMIFRPFQSSIDTYFLLPPNRRFIGLEDAKALYDKLPELIRECPEWWEDVTDRIAAIYSSIEADFFPNDIQAARILDDLQRKGVKIIESYTPRGTGEPRIDFYR